MSIQDRIQMIMRMNNLNASQFADKIGVQRSSISHIISGRNKPSLDFLQKTLDKFPRVNADWLITGKVKQEQTVTNVTGSNQLKEEPLAEYKKTPPLEQTEKEEVQIKGNAPQVEKIVWFYSDGSYRIFENN